MQVYDSVSYGTSLNSSWQDRSSPRSTLDEARKDFKNVWMDYPHLDVRIIKAFLNDEGEQRVSEILDSKKGK